MDSPTRVASIRIASLQRYPVKGLSPEALDQASLSRGGYFPGDRLFAVENGPAGFDPANPEHQPKIKFLMLMRTESLARLRTRYEDETATLVIEEGGRPLDGVNLRHQRGVDEGNRRFGKAQFDRGLTARAGDCRRLRVGKTDVLGGDDLQAPAK